MHRASRIVPASTAARYMKRFPPGALAVMDFDVTTLQAIALLCFNEKPSMTFGEICNEMGMAESDEGKYVMKRVLHPLSCAKDHDILVKTPKYGRFLGVVMVCVRGAPYAHLSLADVQEQEYR